jgi:hypothetical protein
MSYAFLCLSVAKLLANHEGRLHNRNGQTAPNLGESHAALEALNKVLRYNAHFQDNSYCFEHHLTPFLIPLAPRRAPHAISAKNNIRGILTYAHVRFARVRYPGSCRV